MKNKLENQDSSKMENCCWGTWGQCVSKREYLKIQNSIWDDTNFNERWLEQESNHKKYSTLDLGWGSCEFFNLA